MIDNIYEKQKLELELSIIDELYKNNFINRESHINIVKKLTLFET